VIDLLISINWKEYFITVLGISAVSIFYSIILFLLTKPHMSELAQQKFGTPLANPANAVTIQGVLVLFEFAIAEEIVFRLGIQNFLVKYLKLQNNNYWIAIVITSALWTLGHAGVLEPEWVKLAQIFPIGLLLGWLYKKFGAESTMLVHGIFNLVLVFLATYLIK
jgi:membrane protease YdiL (CAAX protease family)